MIALDIILGKPKKAVFIPFNPSIIFVGIDFIEVTAQFLRAIVAFEISSMGIRVSPASLDRQLKLAGKEERRNVP